MSPILKSAEKAGVRALRLKRNPVQISVDIFFSETEKLRAEYAKLIQIKDPKRIVIIPSVSYGIANAAVNLKISRGENIVVVAEQFPSNYYTWQRLCADTHAQLKVADPPSTLQHRGKIWNERILEAIDSNTKAVAIAHTHWTDGTKFDLVAIRKRTREVNALLIVDGTQSVGALPFDVEQIQPDVLVCAGYKWLLGPYSIGLAYYGEYFDSGKPIEESWMNREKSEDFSSLVNYNDHYHSGSLRYEVGEHSNFSHVSMMLKSIGQLNKWGINNIQEYCGSISANAVNMLREKGFWIEEEAHRGKHLFGVRAPSNFNLEKTQRSFLKNKIYVSFRGSAIRVSPNVYNDENDLKKMAAVLIRP